MNLVMKYFVSLPAITWRNFFDFKKVDEAIELQKQSNDQRLCLQLLLSAPKM